MLLFFTNCDMQKPKDLVESSSFTDCGGSLSAELRNPKSIDQAISLINALPKPLTIDCFISALQKPLSTYAVNNQFSAQPAVDVDNPRIFVINGNFLMSFAPAGIGAKLLEMSEVVSVASSVKGEVVFPVMANLPVDAPYSHIISTIGGGTSCRGCHSGETSYPLISSGPAYESGYVKPDPLKKISLVYMQYQSRRCGSSTDSRCKMLRAIFQDNTIDANFP